MKSDWPAKVTLAARVCMGIGLCTSLIIARRIYVQEESRIHAAFVHEIDAYAAAIDAQGHYDIAMLHSLKALFDASELVTRAEFNTFARSQLERYPSLTAVGWIPRVPAEARNEFERRVQEEGLPQFHITERHEQGQMIRAGARDDYYPIAFIEPLEGNQAALGFDLFSDLSRRDALCAGRDTGEARATARITLVQEEGQQGAVQILLPIYDGSPASIAERRDSISGLISGVFRYRDLLSAAAPALLASDLIDMRLTDISTAEGAEVLYEKRNAAATLDPAYRYEKRLAPAAGRQWSLVATPSVAYVAGQRTMSAYLSLLVGALITGWLSFYLAKLGQQKRDVLREVGARTRELRVKRVALVKTNAVLKDEVARRRILQKRFADVIDHEQRRLGQELHDSLGQQVAVTTMLAQTLKQRLVTLAAKETKLLERLIASARTSQTQVRALSKGLLPVEIDCRGLEDALGELVDSTRGVSDADVGFDCDEGVFVEDSIAATHLFRIAQEALRNALEHGQSSRVMISLRHGKRGPVLTIRDDGKGLPDEGKMSHGAGLSIMHHRAELIGAGLDISSPHGEGTSVVCCLSS